MNWASSSGEFAWSLWDARDGPENQFGMQNWMAQGGQPLWQVIWFAAKDEINDLPPMVALGTLNTAKPRRERRAHLTEIWRQTVQTWKDYISLTFYTNRSTHTQTYLPSSTGPPQLHSVTCTCWWSLCTYQNSQGENNSEPDGRLLLRQEESHLGLWDILGEEFLCKICRDTIFVSAQ